MKVGLQNAFFILTLSIVYFEAGILSLIKYFLLLTFILFYINKLNFNKKDIYRGIILIILFILPYQLDINTSLYALRYMSIPISLFIISSAKEVHSKTIIKGVVWSILISSILKILVNGIQIGEWTRFSGYYTDPNFYGLHLIIAFILSKYAIESRITLSIVRIVFLGLSFMTLSRTLLIFIILVLVLEMAFSRKFPRKFSRIAILLTVVSLTLFYLQKSIDFADNISRISEIESVLNNIEIKEIYGGERNIGSFMGLSYTFGSNRLGLWIMGINVIARSLPFGVGFGNYLSQYNEYYIAGVPIIPMHPHNTVIHLLAEFGLIGFILLHILFRPYFKQTFIHPMFIIIILFYCLTLSAYSMSILFILSSLFRKNYDRNIS